MQMNELERRRKVADKVVFKNQKDTYSSHRAYYAERVRKTFHGWYAEIKMMCRNDRVVQIQRAGVCQSHNVDSQTTVRTASDCKSQLVPPVDSLLENAQQL